MLQAYLDPDLYAPKTVMWMASQGVLSFLQRSTLYGVEYNWTNNAVTKTYGDAGWMVKLV